MLTDLQRRKLTRMFHLIDSNKDGVLERADYDGICGRLIEALQVPKSSNEAVEIEQSYAVEWDELQAEADKAGRPVTLDGWLAYRGAQLSGPDAYEVMIEPYVAIVVASLDRDQDGVLLETDVRRYLGLYRMSKVELDEILGKLDPSQRGVFTKQELFDFARDFYFATDEHAPGNWLLGRF